MESISFVKNTSNYLKYSPFQPSLCPFVQVAKFPFEEVPASKQGAKQEPCPSSAVPVSTPSAHGSAGVLDIDTKTGSFIDYILYRDNVFQRLIICALQTSVTIVVQ